MTDPNNDNQDNFFNDDVERDPFADEGEDEDDLSPPTYALEQQALNLCGALAREAERQGLIHPHDDFSWDWHTKYGQEFEARLQQPAAQTAAPAGDAQPGQAQPSAQLNMQPSQPGAAPSSAEGGTSGGADFGFSFGVSGLGGSNGGF